ncbi:MAG: hypothetical protein AAFR50_07835 [Pseudomonadota bacterium]
MEWTARMRWVLLTAQSGPQQAALSLTALVALTVSMVVSLYAAGYDVASAMRDAHLSDAPAAGVISNMGLAVMALGACAALTGAYRYGRLSLCLLGVFCAAFVIDDALMFHAHLGSWKVLVFAAFGGLAAAILHAFWRELGRVPWPMLLAVLAFALSAVIDTFWDVALELVVATEMTRAQRAFGLILEDLPKLAGIGVVTLFALGESFRAPAAPASLVRVAYRARARAQLGPLARRHAGHPSLSSAL